MPLDPRRRLPLEGAENFRDLGGYPTEDGRRVAWRRLFRSGSLARLSPADLEALRALPLRTIIDLRGKAEVAAAGEGPHAALQAARLHHPLLTTRQLRPTLDYADWAERGRQPLAAVLGLLADEPDPLPAVFHCSAGKDRTGIVAALLLGALGVPRDLIVEDYALSRRYFQPLADGPTRRHWQAEVQRLFPGVPLGLTRQLLDADPATMTRFLDALEGKYGSIGGYLGALGFGPARLARLRERLLE